MDKNTAEIRKNILKMVHYSHASHIGSALSVVDILYVLYSRITDITKQNISYIDRDKVILSKGHASVALYSVLAYMGLLEEERLDQYYIDGGTLPGHLDKDSAEGIDCSTGSLGHGASIGIGMALALPKQRVFVIMGDGECNEGSVWEAIIFSGKHRLPNLTFVIDNNNLQGLGWVNEIADYSKLSDTLKNFGLDAYDVDGHDLDALETVFNKTSIKTKAVIAHTVKGNGVSYMENEFKWHYKSPNDSEFAIALEELSL